MYHGPNTGDDTDMCPHHDDCVYAIAGFKIAPQGESLAKFFPA